MKKLLAALLLCAFCISFAACQPTPDEPFVVSKGDGKLIGTIYGESAPELSEPYQALEHWTENIDGKVEDRLTIEVDADVHVPDVLNYPVYEAVYADYDQASFEHFLNNTIGDVDLFSVHPYQVNGSDFEYDYASVNEAQRYIDGLNYQLDDINSPFNKYFLPEAAKSEGDMVKASFLRKLEAYTYILNHQSEFMTKVDKQYKNIEDSPENQFTDVDGTVTEETTRWFTSDGNSKIYIDRMMDQASYLTYEPNGLSTGTTFAKGRTLAKTKDLRGMQIDEESAKKQADAWCEKLGFNDWTLVNTGAAQINTLDRKLMSDVYLTGYDYADRKRVDEYEFYKKYENYEYEPECYLFTYTPSKDGVPSLYFSNKLSVSYGNNDWYMPYLQVVVDQTGVRAVTLVNGNSGFGECLNTNIALLPFEKVQKKFRDYIVMNTDFTGSKTYDPMHGTFKTESERTWDSHEMTRIHIDDVQLGYIKVKEINTDDYMAIPAWCFYGQEYNRFKVGETQLILDENNESWLETPAGHAFLCINAIDGSIIDLTQGY